MIEGMWEASAKAGLVGAAAMPRATNLAARGKRAANMAALHRYHPNLYGCKLGPSHTGETAAASQTKSWVWSAAISVM